MTQASPEHSGTISLGNGTADTITLRGEMPTHGTVKVRNNGDSVHLLAISKVAERSDRRPSAGRVRQPDDGDLPHPWQ